MLREEAIKHGKEQLEVFGGEHREFIEMAIKALEPCEDAIDRAEAMTEIMMFAGNVKSDEEDIYIKVSDAVQLLRELPSVTPHQRIGHWIDIMVGDMPAQACDQCNTFYPLAYTGGGHKYCPNCGAEMESEE